MRKLPIILGALLLLGSCSLFEKPSMNQEEIDQMVAKNKALEEEIASIEAKYEAELSKIKAEQATMLQEQENQSKPSSGMYYVVVGSFKTPKYATEYAEKIRQMGGDGTIIDGPSSFQFVSYSAFPTLREAANAMQQARVNISSESWIYQVK